MAYNKNLPAGTYRARALQADCFPTKNGEGLMLGVEWVVDDGEFKGSQISGNICLIDGSGNPTKNYESVREWAKSWNGIDTDYFKGHFGEWSVDIVVERKEVEINGQMEERPEVKWVNDPNGSHGKQITAGNHKALGAKFGSKLKALAANYNRQHPEAAKPGSGNGTKRTVGTGTAAAPEKPTKKQLTRGEEAWSKFKEKHQDAKDRQELNTLWFELVGKFTDSTDYRNLPDDVWNQVIEDLDGTQGIEDVADGDMPF